MNRWYWLGGALFAATACGGDGGNDLPTTPPEAVTMVTSDGFESPMDAVASPDGSVFYFSGHLTDPDSATLSSAALFSVPSTGGATETLFAGLPLEDPSGLLLSCDGATLYVADASYRVGDADTEVTEEELSPIYQIGSGGGTLATLSVSGIGEAASMAMGPDCETIYVTGFTEAGVAALFTIPVEGGAATIVKEGEPLVSPSGVHVDEDRVAWVMDHLPNNMLGGALFAIAPDGGTTAVVEELRLSEPAGVSLVAGGGTAVMSITNEDGQGQLLTVEIESGERTVVDSTMAGPAGLKTARGAGIFAVADADGDAIYRAE